MNLTLPLALAVGVGLLFSAASVTKAAESGVTNAVHTTDADETLVRTVSYSTGESGNRLRWLPVRPTKAEASQRPVAKMAQFVSPSSQPRQSGSADPFNDPFGDFGEMGQIDMPPPPSKLPGDEQIEKPSFRPLLDDMPSMPIKGAQPQIGSSGEAETVEVPSWEDALAEGPDADLDKCPTPGDLKRINEITYNIAPDGTRFPRECELGKVAFSPRAWEPVTFTWKASGVCNKPLYFEAAQVERYGHSWGPYIQPIVSGAHFFINVPLLPYNMGLYPPGECMYDLGYYRPGNCAPYMLDPLPFSIRAGLAQAGVWVGLSSAIP